MEASISNGQYCRELFRGHRERSYPGNEAYDLAQIAIGNVINAFEGLFLPHVVLKAIGEAKNPNAVSRAVRTRLPNLK